MTEFWSVYTKTREQYWYADDSIASSGDIHFKSANWEWSRISF